MTSMLEISQQADADPAANYPSAASDTSTGPSQSSDDPDSSSDDDECPVPLHFVQKPIRFKTATTYWSKFHADLPTVDVQDASGQELASFPLRFLLEGHVANVGYILEMIHKTFKDEGSLRWPGTDRLAEPEDLITEPAKILFIRKDGLQLPCEPRDGPIFRHAYGLLMSMLQWRTTVIEQNKYFLSNEIAKVHNELRNRFESSIITGSTERGVGPFPIVPPPLEEPIMEEVLRVWGERPSYTDPAIFPEDMRQRSSSLSAWLFLDDSEQIMWEFGGLALYPSPQGYVVHTFWPNARHGKIIPREVSGDDPPDARLLDWHYQQCAMKHLRGVTAGRLPCDFENLRWACYEGESQLLDKATPDDRL